MTSGIRIRGAAEHNLRRIEIDIPHDRLVVVTGVLEQHREQHQRAGEAGDRPAVRRPG